MNPYDFVRIDWEHPGRRGRALEADRFGGISGRLEGIITTLTPFMILAKPPGNLNDPRTSLRDQERHALIPGSSLKGMIRNLVETLSGGAWWFFGDRGTQGTWSDKRVQGGKVNYSPHLLPTFRRPHNRDDLDAACRMFGFLGGQGNNGDSQALLGRVSFDDGICVTPQECQAIYTCILSTPKPRHRVWYLDSTGKWVAGRKFYFHSQELRTESGWRPKDCQPGKKCQNQYIKPLAANNSFTFHAQFTGLDVDDFALLLYALVLEEGMRHKFGYAKPAGLGSVHIQLNWIDLIDYHARYRSGGGVTRYERAGVHGDTLQPFLAQQIAPYTNNRTSVTLQDLRRIWQWPPVHVQTYPSQHWFAKNPTTPIRQTP